VLRDEEVVILKQGGPLVLKFMNLHEQGSRGSFFTGHALSPKRVLEGLPRVAQLLKIDQSVEKLFVALDTRLETETLEKKSLLIFHVFNPISVENWVFDFSTTARKEKTKRMKQQRNHNQRI